MPRCLWRAWRNLYYTKCIFMATKKKNWIFVGIGLWLIVLPFLGFPGAWKTFFMVVSGLLVGVISFLEIIQRREKDNRSLLNNSETPESGVMSS